MQVQCLYPLSQLGSVSVQRGFYSRFSAQSTPKEGNQRVFLEAAPKCIQKEIENGSQGQQERIKHTLQSDWKLEKKEGEKENQRHS